MGIIKYGTFNDTYKNKNVKIRVLVEGYNDKDNKFIITNTWLNKDDLVNIGIMRKKK